MYKELLEIRNNILKHTRLENMQDVMWELNKLDTYILKYEKQLKNLRLQSVSSSLSTIGFADAGKTAKEKKRGIIIVGSGIDERPKTQAELIQLQLTMIDISCTELFIEKPNKRDKYKKKFHN